MTPPPITSAPAALRSWSIEHEVKPLFARAFEAHPQVRSILLCVGQFWADEADDAVHGHLVFSTRHTPRWPHTCEDSYSGTTGDGDLCSACAWDRTTEGMDTTFVSWDSNGFAVRAWQALCTEGASQEDDPSLAYSPAVLARRAEGGFALEVIGRVPRPWLDLPSAALPLWFQEEGTARLVAPLIPERDPAERAFREAIANAPFDDGPRHVFADWLQQRQDPLGEFIALSLVARRTPEAEARRRHLQAMYGEAWLGPLVNVVADPDFSRGLLTGATVHFDEANAHLADEPAFATVERLRFGPTSEVRFSKAMTALRAVAGLRNPRGAPLPATVTEVTCTREYLDGGLPEHVRSLTVCVDGERPEGEALEVLRRTGTLARLDRLAIACLRPAEDRRRVAVAPPEEVRTFAIGGCGAAGAPDGWWLEHTRGEPARLSLEGLGGGSSEAFAGFLLQHPGNRGATSLLLVPGPLWAPSVAEVSRLTASAGVPVEVAGAAAEPEPPPLDAPPRAPAAPMPVHVDPITRAVRLDVPSREGVKEGTAKLPRFPVFVLIVGVLGLLARACAAGS